MSRSTTQIKRRRIEECNTTQSSDFVHSLGGDEQLSLLPPPPLSPTSRDGGDSNVPQPIRQFSHVDGQFATHIFIPIRPVVELQQRLDSALSRLYSTDHRIQRIAVQDYHVSLSRTITLRRPQLSGFSDALKIALRRCVAPRLQTGHIIELANDTRTRFFCSVEMCSVSAGARPDVDALIDAIDGVVSTYGGDCFYRERRLHFSIGWSLQPLPSLARISGALNGHTPVAVNQVVCRTGERETAFSLRSSRDSTARDTLVECNNKKHDF